MRTLKEELAAKIRVQATKALRSYRRSWSVLVGRHGAAIISAALAYLDEHKLALHDPPSELRDALASLLDLQTRFLFLDGRPVAPDDPEDLGLIYLQSREAPAVLPDPGPQAVVSPPWVRVLIDPTANYLAIESSLRRHGIGIEAPPSGAGWDGKWGLETGFRILLRRRQHPTESKEASYRAVGIEPDDVTRPQAWRSLKAATEATVAHVRWLRERWREQRSATAWFRGVGSAVPHFSGGPVPDEPDFVRAARLWVMRASHRAW